MKLKKFLLLLSLSKDNAALGKVVSEAIRSRVDSNCRPLWVDSKGVGFFIASSLTSSQIWKAALPPNLTHDQQQSLRDMLILELADDHSGYPESKAMAWLNSHR